MDPPDLELLLARGDFGAAAELGLRTHGPQIYGYLRSVLREDDLTDDAFSEFSEDLWKGLPSFRRQSTFRAWAYRLAWHAALRVLRDPYRRRAHRFESHQWSQMVEAVRTETAAYLRTTARDKMARFRAALSVEEQTLLTLRLDRKMSWREVASVLSTPEASVTEQVLWKRFERIKAKIRELAREEE